MLNLNNNTIIYIYSTYGIATGGVELLHQLCDVLNNNGLVGKMVYVDEKFSILNVPLMDAYKHYNLSISSYVEDRSDNIFVFYESIFFRYNNIKHGQKVFWWLSVDNFFHQGINYLKIWDILRFNRRLGLKLLAKRIQLLLKNGQNKFRGNISLKELSNLEVLNGYQSEYAHQFLLNNNFYYVRPLTDYINIKNNKENIDSTTKINQILYNPTKGFKVTKKLIEIAPNFNWFPLKGLTRDQVDQKLLESKIYIDFGNHPGKDRLPREAAFSNCVVITGKEGAAKFYEDIPILSKYKKEMRTRDDANEIISTIDSIFNSFDIHLNEFTNYRNDIKGEKEKFIREVLAIFKLNNNGRE